MSSSNLPMITTEEELMINNSLKLDDRSYLRIRDFKTYMLEMYKPGVDGLYYRSELII